MYGIIYLLRVNRIQPFLFTNGRSVPNAVYSVHVDPLIWDVDPPCEAGNMGHIVLLEAAKVKARL
jgi:hypothetical protein